MIVLRITGGLGNQMYQYALGAVLQTKYPKTEICYDISHYYRNYDHTGVILEKVFNIKLSIVEKKKLKNIYYGLIFNEHWSKIPDRIQKNQAERIVYWINFIKQAFSRKRKRNYITDYKFNIYNDSVFTLDQNRDWYLQGYWQNNSYYAGYEKFLQNKVFKFKRALEGEDLNLVKAIENTMSISVHVRRGDFVNTEFELCDSSYYLHAIEIMRRKYKDATFYIFSDAPEYVRDIFKGEEFVFVEHSAEDCDYDMHLMSLCKHNIIANSSFSFWGAFLNQNENKTVIAPKYFLKGDGCVHEGHLPLDWILIDNLGEQV